MGSDADKPKRWRPWQFSLRTLLMAVAVCAVALMIGSLAGIAASIFWLLILGISLIGRPSTKCDHARYALCLLILNCSVFLGYVCAYAAYYTVGEVGQVTYLLFLPLLLMPAFLLASRLWNAAMVSAIALATIACILLVPEQLDLVRRLWRLQEEAALIVAHVHESKDAQTGYPNGLDGYEFRHPRLADHFRYSRSGEDFELDYWVEQPGISYWYSSKTGWGYYPD